MIYFYPYFYMKQHKLNVMIPNQYQWLHTIGLLPRTVTAFFAIYGTKEVPGEGNNPIIMSWAKTLGIKEFIKDSIAWCGLAMAWILFQAGYNDALKSVTNKLWARDYLKFGTPVKTPMLGDILVFEREGGFGHVGLYIAEDSECYHCGGGNTSDNVIITRIKKDRLLGARRYPFKVAMAASVKRYFVDSKGTISTNEA